MLIPRLMGEEDTIYDEDGMEEQVEDDEISPEEEGFMRGYEQETKEKPEKEPEKEAKKKKKAK